MKITILGSGTSSGVPVIGCTCDVCTSNDPKDRRLRCSIFIDLGSNYNEGVRFILIDTGPDFREQAIRYKIPRIDAVLFTHAHADHIFGLDDIRIFNFRQKGSIPLYADERTKEALNRIFAYCFFKDPKYEGGGVPSLVLHKITAEAPFKVGEHQIIPIQVQHGKTPILGFKIGGFAYLTDCSGVTNESLDLLQNLEMLVVSGLRYREHPTHFTIPQAITFIESLGAKSAYLTHIGHEVKHHEVNNAIYKETNGKVSLAYDGLEIFL